MGEILFHVFLMAVLGIFYNQTLQINTARMTDPIGPAGFPQMIIIAAFILLAVSMRNSIKAIYRDKKSEEWKVNGKVKEFDLGFLAVLATIIGFILLVNHIGFWISSVVLIGIILIILGQRKVYKVVAVTIIASLVFSIVFGKVLHVPLPRGIGVFRMISYFLY